jgi:HSP20 family molecular chaperone IbpA
MFGKQLCSRCGKKTSKKHDFCPSCGHNLKGKDESFFEPSFKMGFPFNALMKQLTKQIERQMKDLDKEMAEPPTFEDKKEKKQVKPMQGISISISSAGGQPVIKVNDLGKTKIKEVKKAPIQQPKITKEQAEKFSKLPREEPLTSVRRLTDKIIYEIDLPDVKKEDIIITRMHNSIEIKAITRDKAFFKLIPVSLPILKSQLKEGKLLLELKPL